MNNPLQLIDKLPMYYNLINYQYSRQNTYYSYILLTYSIPRIDKLEYIFSPSSFWGHQTFLFKISNLKNHLSFNDSKGKVISQLTILWFSSKALQRGAWDGNKQSYFSRSPLPLKSKPPPGNCWSLRDILWKQRALKMDSPTKIISPHYLLLLHCSAV